MFYLYKWTLLANSHPPAVLAYGLDPKGRTHTLRFPYQDAILLAPETDAAPLPGVTVLEGTSFTDEYESAPQDGTAPYTKLCLLPSGPQISVQTLREIGQNPHRWRYHKAFLHQIDPSHRYFLYKNIPYYTGWFDEHGTPLPDQRDLPPCRVLFFDIECLSADTGRFPSELQPDDPIVSIAFLLCEMGAEASRILSATVLLVADRTDDLSTDRYDVKTFPTERELLLHALQIFSDDTHAFICGFNSAWFDNKYLAGRFFYYQLDKRLLKWQYPFGDEGAVSLWFQPHHLCLDVFAFYKTYLRYEQYSLDYLSRTVLQDTKQPMSFEVMKRICLAINEAPLEEIRLLLDYNYHDAYLTYRLCEAAKLLPFTFTISALCYLDIERVILAGKSELLTGYITIQGYRHGYLVNNTTKVRPECKRQTYRGALVYLQKPGIYQNVSTIDFVALYPSIISAKNLSPSTCVEKTHPPLTSEDQAAFFSVQLAPQRYCWSMRKTVRTGLFPLICQRLCDMRRRVKSQLTGDQLPETERRYLSYLQLALKILNNSIYGNLGAAFSPFYSRITAEGVTAHARETIQMARDYFEARQIPVLFLDTDSLFLQTSSEKSGRALTAEVNEHIRIPELKMEYEHFYHKIFLFSKKKYFGLLQQTYKSSGFELNKRDFPLHCKTILNDLLKQLLQDEVQLVADFTHYRDRLFRFDLALQYELFSKTLSLKPLYQYAPDCSAPHVKFIQRQGSQSSILRARIVSLLKSPLSEHQKQGYNLCLLSQNYTDSLSKPTIPVNLTSCVKPACVLFDKIYSIVAKKEIRYFRECLETLVKFNLVLFELRCVSVNAIVTFHKSFSIQVPDICTIRPRNQSTITQYFKKQQA